MGEATTHYHQPLTNKAFMESNITTTATIALVSVAVATIAQAIATVGQRGVE